MNYRSRAIRFVRPWLKQQYGLKKALRQADDYLGVLRHSAALHVPTLIRPAPRQLTIAVTAACNLRCRGCRYGRDFMTGKSLPLETVRGVLDDARAAGVNTVRYYGGEPLVHPDLPAMISHAKSLGLDAYVTTNGTLLERRIDDLYEAGLRWMTIGFYGVGSKYDEYTQRRGQFDKLRAGIEKIRDRYGSKIEIQINYVLLRQTCTLEALNEAWSFAREYDLYLSVDPVNPPVPFFTNPDKDLNFEEKHRPALEEVSAELLRLKREPPYRLPQSEILLRALPDLLIDPERGSIPCDAYELLWLGADGTVQLCDTYFELGNVHKTRLRDMLFSETHHKACRDGFRLKCPACTCKIDSRIRKHAASIRRYG